MTQLPENKRYILTLDLKDDPDLINEYKYRHRKDTMMREWPEIPQGIKDVGIINMEIFLFKTRLVMIMETKADFDFDKNMNRLAQLPRQKEWEAFVDRFQKSIPGVPSNEKWQLMEKIFELP